MTWWGMSLQLMRGTKAEAGSHPMAAPTMLNPNAAAGTEPSMMLSHPTVTHRGQKAGTEGMTVSGGRAGRDTLTASAKRANEEQMTARAQRVR